jgi:hypothetical protein
MTASNGSLETAIPEQDNRLSKIAYADNPVYRKALEPQPGAIVNDDLHHIQFYLNYLGQWRTMAALYDHLRAT